MYPFFKVTKFLRGIYPLLSQGHKLDNKTLIAKSIKLRETIQELGPTYIKFGQMLSVRYDLFHKTTCDELQKLLDSGIAIEYEVIKSIIKDELGARKSKELLSAMHEKPMAVASIGQVHVGFINSGQKVAIKIQKPHIEKIIRDDVKTFKRIVALASFIPQARKLQLKDLINEFQNWTLKELDFSLEATNIEKFAKLFEEDATVCSPIVYRELSTDKILVTEFIEGPTVKELLPLLCSQPQDEYKYKGKIYSKKVIFDLFLRNVYNQVFKAGFVHADPHPANLIITKPNKICYIDFGIVTTITKDQIDLYKNMVFALISGDLDSLVNDVLQFDQKPGAARKEDITRALKVIVDKYQTSISEEYGPTVAATEIMFVCSRMDIQFPMYLTLLSRLFSIYDGLLQKVDPSANALETVRPLFEEEELNETMKFFNSDNLKNDVAKGYKNLVKLKDLALELPEETLSLVKDISEHGIKLNTTDHEALMEGERTKKYKFKVETMLGISAASFLGFLVVVIKEIKYNIIGLDVASILFVVSVCACLSALVIVMKENE